MLSPTINNTQKDFGSKNFGVQKEFYLGLEKKFGVSKILSLKNIQGKKVLGPKNFGSKKAWSNLGR